MVTVTPFDTPMLGWLDQPYEAVPDHAALFGSTKPEIMGESPYLNGRATGIAFALTKDDRVRAIFLYANGVEDFAQYAGALPGALSFANSRTDVRAALGTPAMSADAGGTGLFAIEHSFDRFEADGFYLRFEYVAGDATVRLVTLGKIED
jgi:hypothetical protein